MKFLVPLIPLLIFCPAHGQANKTTSIAKRIVGMWVSADDNRYRVVFTPARQFEYYGKQLTATHDYTIRKDSLISKDRSNGSVYYYSIALLTRQNLTLLYLERGNLLRFKRKRS